MCTLTYHPGVGNGFIMTSNRDESEQRGKAVLPVFYDQAEQYILMPRDPEGNGTWIATGERDGVACLLNGAFHYHESRPPYRKSRGLVVREVFDHPDMASFLDRFDPQGIEPFTLVVGKSRGKGRDLWELRWDGETLHEKWPDPQKPHVWSAAKLYPQSVIRETEERFRGFLESASEVPSAENIRDFHRQETYQAKLERASVDPVPGLKTLSITSVCLEEERTTHRYEELDRGLVASTQWPVPDPR